jgi:hypothetical protein
MRRPELLAAVGARLMRLLVGTLRVQITDRAGVTGRPPQIPKVCAFWHNRLFIMPHVFQRYLSSRPGAALTSASKDGELVAAMLQRFGIRPIRGSSSRRGGAALVEMKRAADNGYIIGITPDGPRGPRYHLNPGLIKLVQIAGGSVMPMHVTYSRCWRLKSWDGFMIPKPFARVHITFDALHTIPQTADDEAFEYERAKLERMLRQADDE